MLHFEQKTKEAVHKNIAYMSPEITRYYTQHRCTWDEFYDSEKFIFNKVAQLKNNHLGKILDVGCAAGGLGFALKEVLPFASYHGVDIHEEVIEKAKEKSLHLGYKDFHFLAGDILHTLPPYPAYDTVCALSCADWNIETDSIIKRCWDFVADEGYLVISFRLTNQETVNDFTRSYQFVSFKDITHINQNEKASYVIFNTLELLKKLSSLSPQTIHGYGYWGRPSASAVTIYEKIGFGVFALQKKQGFQEDPRLELSLPSGLL